MKIILLLPIVLYIIWNLFSTSYTKDKTTNIDQPSFPLDTDGGTVTLNDIPLVIEQIVKTGRDGAFAVFLIPDTHGDDGDMANLQISIENNKLGVDWVLLADRNISDKEYFTKIIEKNHLIAKQFTMNEVTYLRVENASDVNKLIKDLLIEMYEVGDSEKLDLIITDFEWPSN